MITIKIEGCARCGQDHEVSFKELTNPQDEWNYWGTCPNTTEPLLIHIKLVDYAEEE